MAVQPSNFSVVVLLCAGRKEKEMFKGNWDLYDCDGEGCRAKAKLEAGKDVRDYPDFSDFLWTLDVLTGKTYCPDCQKREKQYNMEARLQPLVGCLTLRGVSLQIN